MIHIDLLKLLHGEVDVQREKSTFDGVTVGIVTSIEDEEHLGRIRVKFPFIADQIESGWARLSTPWAGKGRGHYFVPEVDDEVLVAFEHGDLRHPYVLGCVWSADAPPPILEPASQKREIRSKSGHALTYDDSTGHETVELRSQGKHVIVLDDSDGAAKISIVDSTKQFSIVIDAAAQKITIKSSGEVEVNAATKLTLSGANVDIGSSGTMNLHASGAFQINGQAVKIN
jgi:phage baseplate assembly protein V